MSVFTGRQYPGAMRDHRARKRAEAEARNEAAPMGRRRAVRRVAERLGATA